MSGRELLVVGGRRLGIALWSRAVFVRFGEYAPGWGWDWRALVVPGLKQEQAVLVEACSRRRWSLLTIEMGG